MDFYIFHFGVKNGTLYSKKKENDMAHLEKYSRSQQHVLNMTPGQKRPNGNYIRVGNEEIGTNPNSF